MSRQIPPMKRAMMIPMMVLVNGMVYQLFSDVAEFAFCDCFDDWLFVSVTIAVEAVSDEFDSTGDWHGDDVDDSFTDLSQ